MANETKLVREPIMLDGGREKKNVCCFVNRYGYPVAWLKPAIPLAITVRQITRKYSLAWILRILQEKKRLRVLITPKVTLVYRKWCN